MNSNSKMAAAVVGGYLLGRTKKARMAIGLGMFLAGKKLNLDPREIGKQLAASPVFSALNTQMREELVDATKAAATDALTKRVTGLADSLHRRTLALDDIPADVPDVDLPGGGRGAAREDEPDEDASDAEPSEDEDVRDEDAGDEEEAESSGSKKPAERRSSDTKSSARSKSSRPQASRSQASGAKASDSKASDSKTSGAKSAGRTKQTGKTAGGAARGKPKGGAAKKSGSTSGSSAGSRRTAASSRRSGGGNA